MKKFSLCFLVAIVITSAFAISAAADKVIIYAALDEKTANELAEAFNAESCSDFFLPLRSPKRTFLSRNFLKWFLSSHYFRRRSWWPSAI